MNAKMSVLFVKKTGHALGAVTRASDPEGEVTATVLAGQGLIVRNIAKQAAAVAVSGEVLLIDAATLEVATVDLNPEVLAAPGRFVVGGGAASRLGGALPNSLPPPPPPPLLNTTQITVTVPVAAGEDGLAVWVQVQELGPSAGATPERRVIEGTIEKTKKSVTLDLTVQPGGPMASLPEGTAANKKPYVVMALVGGYSPYIQRHTLPN